MPVCSGWMPQRVMICGISETVDKMTSTLSPSELLSRLCGKPGCQGAQEGMCLLESKNACKGKAFANVSVGTDTKRTLGVGSSVSWPT